MTPVMWSFDRFPEKSLMDDFANHQQSRGQNVARFRDLNPTI
jgi:hypothetical protein